MGSLAGQRPNHVNYVKVRSIVMTTSNQQER